MEVIKIKKFRSVDELPAVLNVDDVASFLKISKAMAYNLFKASNFPTLKIGTRLMTPKSSFLKWMEKNTTEI